MALNGRFEADFQSFYDAVDKASAKLKAFESDTAGVEKSLNAMVDHFSPVNAISQATLMAEAIERIGGAAKLTSDQLQEAQRTFDAATEAASKWGLALPEGIQKTAGEVEHLKGSWDQFLGSFNVEDAIKHPIDTATEALLSFARSTDAATAGAIGLHAGVAALAVEAYRLADASAQVGEHLGVLNEQTGISIPTLSRYSEALKVTGGDMGTLTTAVDAFEQRAAQSTGTDKFARGLELIGTSLEQVRSMNPDQMLELMTDGFARMDDQQKIAAAGADLFGRNWRNVVPILKDVADGMQRTSDITPWSSQQSAAATEFERNWRSMKEAVSALEEELGKTFIPMINRTADEIRALYNALAPTVKIVNDWAQGIADWLDYLAGGMGKVPDIAEPAVKVTHDYADAVQAAGQAGEGLNNVLASTPGSVNSITAAFDAEKKAIPELNRDLATHNEQLRAIADLEKQYWSTVAKDSQASVDAQVAAIWRAADEQIAALEQTKRGSKEAYDWIYAIAQQNADNLVNRVLKEQTVEAAKLWEDYYKEVARGSEQTTEQQIAAIARVADAQIAKLQEVGKWSQDAQDAIYATMNAKVDNLISVTLANQIKTAEKLWDEYSKAVLAKDSDTTTGRIRAAWTAYDAEVQALSQTKNASFEAYDAIYAKYVQITQNIMRVDQEKDKFSKEYYEKQARDAQAYLDALQADWENHLASEIEAAQRAAQAAAEALTHWQDYAQRAWDALRPPGGAAPAPTTGSPYATAPPISAPGFKPTPVLGQPMFRQSGGPVSAGSAYTVGEAGPELFVPSTNGSIVPNAGAVYHTTIAVSGLLDPRTIAQLTEAVGNEMMRRSGRQWPAA